jgi:hypothetical protein
VPQKLSSKIGCHYSLAAVEREALSEVAIRVSGITVSFIEIINFFDLYSVVIGSRSRTFDINSGYRLLQAWSHDGSEFSDSDLSERLKDLNRKLIFSLSSGYPLSAAAQAEVILDIWCQLKFGCFRENDVPVWRIIASKLGWLDRKITSI